MEEERLKSPAEETPYARISWFAHRTARLRQFADATERTTIVAQCDSDIRLPCAWLSVNSLHH
jgi:hypothetical protein